MSDRPILDAPPITVGTTPTRTPAAPQLLLLLATSCLPVLGAVLIAPVLPRMRDAFASVAEVDVLVPVTLTIPALFIALAAPFAGVLVDRVDRKRVLTVALIGYAVAGTAPLYLTSLPAIMVSRALVGVCEAAIITCSTTLIGDYWSGAKRTRYLSLQTLVTALAATVFLALGGALGTSGWRTPFWLYGVALLLAPLAAVALWQPARSARPESGRRLEPLPWRQLLKPSLVTLAGSIIFYTLIVELSFLLTDAGLTAPAGIGGIGALMSVATATGCVLFARLSHRTVRTLLPVAFALAAIGFALVSATREVPVIAAGAVLAGLGTGILLPTLLTWAVNTLDFERRGRGTGLFTAVLFTGQFLCPLVIAAISTATGGLRPAIGILGGAAALMAAVGVVATRNHAVPLNVTVD